MRGASGNGVGGMRQQFRDLRIARVGLHETPRTALTPIEENEFKMARKEIQIMGLLWQRRGERVSTGEIAKETATPANSCYVYLMRLWRDGLIRKRRKSKLGGALEWWME